MDKTKVICDSNVWYNFALYGIDKFFPYFGNAQLCVTNLSYFEMLSSEWVFHNLELVQKAQHAISAARATMIAAPDVLYVISELEMKIECPSDLVVSQSEFSMFYNRFLNASSFWQLGCRQHWAILNRKIHAKIWTCGINHAIAGLTNREKLSLGDFRDFVVNLLKSDIEYYIDRHKIKIVNSPSTEELEKNLYAKFQCYIDAFAGYLYESYKLKLKHKFKIKANDYVDFRNLLYCTSGCRYLTFEKNTKMGVAKMLKIYAPQFVIENMENIRSLALEFQKSKQIN